MHLDKKNFHRSHPQHLQLQHQNLLTQKIVQTKVKVHNLMTKERNGSYNHQQIGIYNHHQITKNIFKEIVEPIHGVQNVMLGGSMML